VLENLVENALRHAPEGSEVQIQSRAAHGGIELRVQDAGPGVPVAQRERVFERFVQHGSDKSTRSNRGLGLAFCKLVVEAHGGRIWIEDGAPGAVFCLWIGPC
jgi:signal transduction histidine kinase